MIDAQDRYIYKGGVRTIRVSTGMDLSGSSTGELTLFARLPDGSVDTHFGTVNAIVDAPAGQITFLTIAAEIQQIGRYLLQVRWLHAAIIKTSPFFDLFVEDVIA